MLSVLSDIYVNLFGLFYVTIEELVCVSEVQGSSNLNITD